MKNKKTSTFAMAISLMFVGMIVFSSCESSRVGPELPRPNPPAPPAQPLVLSGFVKDAGDHSIIAGAAVKLEGTSLSSTTDNNGKYNFNLSSTTGTSFTVSASKTGYGFDAKVPSINRTTNVAIVQDILLAKLQVVTAPVTVATGGSATTTNNQSVASQPLTVTVPPNAVTQPITLTTSAIPAGQLPQPTTTASASVQSAGQFGPSGTQFQQPVTINFPLPSPQTAGKTFSLLQLNEQTQTYTNSGFTATVNADGTSASSPVTHFTIYAIAEDAVLNTTDGTPTIGSEDYLGLQSGSATRIYTATNTLTLSGGSGTVSDNWLKDVISQKLKIDFTSTSTTIGGNFPQLPANFVQNGLQTNPNNPGTSGNWEYRWYVNKSTTTSTGTASGTGWTRNVNIVQESWVIVTAKTGWYWILHNQGGAFNGPY